MPIIPRPGGFPLTQPEPSYSTLAAALTYFNASLEDCAAILYAAELAAMGVGDGAIIALPLVKNSGPVYVMTEGIFTIPSGDVDPSSTTTLADFLVDLALAGQAPTTGQLMYRFSDATGAWILQLNVS